MASAAPLTRKTRQADDTMTKEEVKVNMFPEFLPHTPLGLSGYCFHPWCLDGWVRGRQEKVFLALISETGVGS